MYQQFFLSESYQISALYQFVLENRKAQKYLLGVFEMIVGEIHPELIPRAAHILKAFYDNDILEEETILEWADKVGTNWHGMSCWWH